VYTVVGDVLVDLVGRAPDFTAHAGGSAYNVAITLGRLGCPVALVARTGHDAFGRILADKARASGVSFEHWQTVDEPTTLAVASLAADGSASYDFYLDGTAGQGVGGGLVDVQSTGDVLHLGSIASWRPPSAAVLQALQRRAYEGGATLISYDPNVRPALIADRDTVRASIEGCVAASHLIKASDEDVAFLYPDTAPAEVAKHWCHLGASAVVVTLGAAGAVAFGLDGELARRPGLPITVADTVGAGDSFAAGLLAALGAVRPADLPGHVGAALAQAVVVSAMTCERPGADPPTRAELDARMQSLR
jgi:fructokinase